MRRRSPYHALQPRESNNAQVMENRFLKRYCLSLLLSVGAGLLPGCLERPRNNPFDPAAKQAPVSLELLPAAEQITLNWWLTQPLEDFQSFRLYRAVGSPDSFALYLDFPASQFSYIDQDIQAGRWYYYKMTVVGQGLESLPSAINKAYPGPGSYWALEDNGYMLRRLSYDLLHVFAAYPLFYAAREWAVVPGDSAVWLTYPQFTNVISRLNRFTGQEKLFYPEEIRNVVDIEYNSLEESIFLLDRDKSTVFIFKNENIEETIPLDSREVFRRIRYHQPSNRLFALGDARVQVVNLSIPQHPLDTIPLRQNYQGKDLDVAEAGAYILCAAETQRRSIIYHVSAAAVPADSLEVEGLFYHLRVDGAAARYYLAEDLPSGDDQVVQLSPEGSRQLHWPGFKLVKDIQINPYDRSLLIVDYYGNLLRLYDVQGNFISESRDLNGNLYLYRPLRVYIE